MRAWLLLVVIVTAHFLMACAPATAYPGTPQDFVSACDKPNEGEQIAVEGYLRLPDTVESGDAVVLRLYSDLTFAGKPIGVIMHFGDGANEATKITTSFKDTDLHVHRFDGTLVPFGTRVRVSGRVYFPLTSQDFECGLENPYVETTK